MEYVLADPLYGFDKERPKVEPGTLLGLRALLLEEDKVCRLVVVPAPLEELLGDREVVAVRGVPTYRGERAAMGWSEGYGKVVREEGDG